MGSEWKEEAIKRKDVRRGKYPDLEKTVKKRGGKKPWILEHRFIGKLDPGEDDGWFQKINKDKYTGEWFKGWCNRYKTEKDAQQSLENHLKSGWIYVGDDWESRITLQ